MAKTWLLSSSSSWTMSFMHSTTDLSSISGTSGNFNTQNLVYDKNGNIQRLKRIGANSAGVDNLFYDYSGNQLTRVEDTDDQNVGFKDVSSSPGTKEYLYDYNGNMVKDLNKSITDIEYNYLNLPEKVTLDNGDIIHYAYDATGVKHHKVVDDGTPDTTQYVGPFHFTNSSLKCIQHGEGRALKTGGGYQYEYNLTDHLGNVRVTVDEGGTVIQRQDYYPFGLTFNHSNVSPENLYKLSGNEEQQEWGVYDFNARMYDPALGRFGSVDPLAASQVFYNPYHYNYNNPIVFTDVTGLMPNKQSEQHHDNMSANTTTDDEDGEGDDEDDDELFRRTYRKNGKFHIDIYHKGEISTDSRHNSVAGAGGFGEGHLGSIFGLKGIQLPEWDLDRDGKMSFGEATGWWRWGDGQAVHVRLKNIDLSGVSVSDFDDPDFFKEGKPGIFVRFFSDDYVNRDQALVYGTIGLVLVTDDIVMSPGDTYDFDIKNKRGTLKRDVATIIGLSVAGPGKPFPIHITGVSKIRK